jgi:hypothetical protein
MQLRLKSGAIVLIDDDHAHVADHEWQQIATGHVAAMTTNGDGKPHVLVLDRSITNAPDGWLVEHVNGKLLDNRFENLRLVEGKPYRPHHIGPTKSSKSGVRGVQYIGAWNSKSPWRAHIGYNRHTYSLGSYRTLDEAAAVRRAAELCCFGEIVS